ncbi:NAD(P)/FAD-dependent oxidoreductase [Nitrososphaera viennensis]|uniref:NAD(P)/FAD-dependent oxidoreductase n=2 Tax=Nitrososphaera viennensis TaxID=1034015 RepID=A0A977IGL7_9ARCH|nr:NAD(P)/FAD-dependent oxidoreductase [Nitrososphaera viennensis]AIC15484.1 putative digeranylgeranylglycerophospholipid reductase [Nitrososphaera viennensis EN76]UVS70373.1 NAD(P)/FAD-dependent oxidoreductase [Nitrososphaera viennensis]
MSGQRDYDIIVAGGGLAGMIVGTSAAYYSKQKLKILVIDRNTFPQQGMKTISGWVCGDAVGKNTVDYMAERIHINWGNPEIEHPVKGVVAFSPDHETRVAFDGEGYILNRKMLPQRQMADCKKMGVEFKERVAIRSLIIEDNAVIGVEGEDLANKAPFKKTARLVVDCTGVTSVLRTNFPIKSYIERRIDRDDLEATGRYIYNFELANDDKTYFDPDYCIIHLDQKLAPGGYGWVFPKGKTKVNIGLGVQQKAFEARNKEMGVNPNLTTLINEYVQANPAIKNPTLADGEMDDGNAWGTWQVSVRRQNDCMVSNGYMLVGDSAWMPKPLDAGGIGPAIIAATIAGKDAVEAIEANDTSERNLWKYNKHFINDYGYKTAGLEVFRRMLQGLTNDQINYGMKHFLSKMDIDKITKGEHPEFSTVDKLGMMIRGAMNKKLAEDLRYCANINKKLTDHYFNYPETPDGFSAWQKTLHGMLQEAFAKYK